MNMSFLRLLRLYPASKNYFPTYMRNKHLLNCNKNGLKNFNTTREVFRNEVLNKKNYSNEKDKLLFYYENPKLFRMVNIFSFIQFIFWCNMAEFVISKKNIDKISNNEELLWWQKINFEDKTSRRLVAAVCFLLGYGVLCIASLYTCRSVRLLVLRKDGKTLSIVTYGPFRFNQILEVPLEKVSADVAREYAKQQLPIKVQGKLFYYILDTKNGTFQNPELFDYTAGMKRTFKK